MRVKMGVRWISIFIVSCILVTSLPETTFVAEANGEGITAQSEEIESGDYRISVRQDESGKDTAVITGYLGSGGDVIVPGEIAGYPVAGIGERAFIYCSDLTGIKLPEGVENIGKNAFFQCSSLESVQLPKELTNIGVAAFSQCSSLENIELPEGLTVIEEQLFQGCYSLKNVVFPEGLKTIRNSAFSGCSELTAIELPRSLESIEMGVFAGCSDIKSMELPENLWNIGGGDVSFGMEGTFQGCYNLESVKLPEGIRKIQDYTFWGCSSLKSIELPESIDYIGADVFRDCTSLTSIVWPEGAKDIGWEAFIGCSGLTSIILPEGIENMGRRAFSGCSALTEIELPDSLPYIAMEGFMGCSSLKRIKLPESATAIGEKAFMGCGSLMDITLPEEIESIGEYAFSGCDSLMELELPSSVEKISEYAFKDEEGKLPDNLVLCVYAGSYAEEYVMKYDIPFKYLAARPTSLQVKIPMIASDANLKGLQLIVSNGDYRVARRLTKATGYTFNGIPAGQGYQISLKNTYGDVIASAENVELLEGRNGIELTEILTLSDVNVHVMAGDLDVTDKCGIFWMDGEKNIYASKASLVQVPVGKSLVCRVKPDGDLGKAYSIPQDMEWSVSAQGKDCVISLQPFQKVRLTGTVEQENELLQGVSVSVAQKLNGIYEENTFVRTDREGVFELEVYNQPAVLTVNAIGCQPYTVALEELTEDRNIGQILMEELNGTNLEVHAVYTERAEEGTEPSEKSLNNLNDISFDIHNQTTGLEVENVIPVGDSLILSEGVKAGDTLSLTAISRSDDFIPVTCTVTVEDGNRAEVSLRLVQRGSVKTSYGTAKNDAVRLLIYDAAGKRVWMGTFNNDKFLQSDGLSDGTYTAVAMKDSRFLAYPVFLRGLKDLGMQDKTDYISSQVTVKGGKIAEVTFGEIPEFSEENYYINDLRTTQFALSRLEGNVGKYISLRAVAPLREEFRGRVRDVKWVFGIPEECEIIEEALTSGGNLCTDVSFGEQEIIVSSVSAEDMLRMCLLPTEAGNYEISASLEYTLDGRLVRQPIGSLELKVQALSLSVPEKTIEKNVYVSGTALHNSQVSVYDNDVLVGQTTANASGQWSVDIELYKPYTYSEHQIYAQVQTSMGQAVRTEERMLVYQYMERPIQVKHVIMTNTCSGTGQNVIYFDFAGEAKESKSYVYDPNYPMFTFVTEMEGEDPGRAQDVSLDILCTDGNTRTLHPKFDEKKQQWVICQEFYSSSLPKNVSVSYSLDAEVIYSVEQQEDIIEAWKCISDLAENVQFSKLTVPAGVNAGKELREAYDEYNRAIEEVQETRRGCPI